MSSDKPSVAFALSLAGGIIIYTVGFIRTIRFTVTGIPGIICGTLIIISSIMMYCKPAQHKKWSLIVMIFSMLSWIGGLGGLIVGFVLSFIGAILGFRWKTSYARQDSQPSRRSREVSTVSNRYCFSCGREISSEHRFCPYCGKPLPE